MNIFEEYRNNNMTKIDINNIKITPDIEKELIELQDLTTLFMNQCNLTYIPQLSHTLIKLDISSNDIKEINLNLPRLQVLNISNNKLTTLNSDMLLTPQLRELLVTSNNITRVDLDLPVLEILDLTDNPLHSFNIPTSVSMLYICDCGLIYVPILPHVRELICNTNNIKILPKTWWPNLVSLDLSFNQIVKIDTFPPNAEMIDLSNNQLTKLSNEYPSSLTNLDVSNNYIKEYDEKYFNIEYFNHDPIPEYNDQIERQIFYDQPLSLEAQDIKEIMNTYENNQNNYENNQNNYETHSGASAVTQYGASAATQYGASTAAQYGASAAAQYGASAAAQQELSDSKNISVDMNSKPYDNQTNDTNYINYGSSSDSSSDSSSGSSSSSSGSSSELTSGSSSEPTFGSSSEPTFGSSSEPTFGSSSDNQTTDTVSEMSDTAPASDNDNQEEDEDEDEDEDPEEDEEEEENSESDSESENMLRSDSDSETALRSDSDDSNLSRVKGKRVINLGSSDSDVDKFCGLKSKNKYDKSNNNDNDNEYKERFTQLLEARIRYQEQQQRQQQQDYQQQQKKHQEQLIIHKQSKDSESIQNIISETLIDINQPMRIMHTKQIII
jgi:Leucine-rich repeat (LRR) protein